MIRIFVGWDSNEAVASSVLIHSLMRTAKEPISITPMILGHLPMTRKRAKYQSTEFSFSRFLVPYLCEYKGRAIFMDGDMLCRSDIGELWKLTDTPHAISVVKNDYKPKQEDKFLGSKQSLYEKKNWSSLMVFNNALCKALTPQIVNEASGLYLHQFKWLQDDSLIGEIPVEWNHLVGEYARNPNDKIAHLTRGTPCFQAYSQCEFAAEWYQELDRLNDYDRIGEYKVKHEIRAV